MFFKVWDTAGQERFRSLVPMYYRNSDAVAIIFDVSDRESFNQVRIWINGIYTTKNCLKLVKHLLILRYYFNVYVLI